jgi:hypothetical protein
MGFGSGLNISFYASRVTRVAAVKPADLGWRLADRPLKATPMPCASRRPEPPIVACMKATMARSLGLN